MVIILITFIICVDHIPLLYYLFIIEYRNILVETNWTTKLVVRKSRDDISLDYTQETEVVPEDISTTNIEDSILMQNPDLNLRKVEIVDKFSYVTKNMNRNLAVLVGADTR